MDEQREQLAVEQLKERNSNLKKNLKKNSRRNSLVGVRKVALFQKIKKKKKLFFVEIIST